MEKESFSVDEFSFDFGTFLNPIQKKIIKKT
jgi:hypothetical protein